MCYIQWGLPGSFAPHLVSQRPRQIFVPPPSECCSGGGKNQWFHTHCLVSIHLEVTHVNSICMSVTRASHTAASDFKAVGKCNLTLCLEGGEWTYLLGALVTTTQHWQELGEMDTCRHPGSSVNQHRFSRKQVVKMCVKALKGSSFSSSCNLLLGSRNLDKDYEQKCMLTHSLYM